MQAPETVQHSLDTVVAWARSFTSFATIVAVVGLLTMAVIQTAKDILPLRRWFQRAWISNWLRQRSWGASQVDKFIAIARDLREKTHGEVSKKESHAILHELEMKVSGYQPDSVRIEPIEKLKRRTKGALSRPDAENIIEMIREKRQSRQTSPPEDSRDSRMAREAREDLVRLATAGEYKAFYELPIEQLCGQINAAVQVALDSPEQHRDLVLCLSYTAGGEDLDHALEPPRALHEPKGEGREADDEAVRDFMSARNRVFHQVQRAVDGLQIGAGFRWKLLLQMASIALGALFASVGLALSESRLNLGTNWRVILFTSILVGIFSGFLAPIARDLVAVLQRLRR